MSLTAMDMEGDGEDEDGEVDTDLQEKIDEDRRVGAALLRCLESHAAMLGEHFDTVQIVATKHDGADGESFWLTAGVGDIHGRIGATKRLVLATEEFWKQGHHV